MREPIRLSPLGFGCAPIMGKVGKSQAMHAMALAYELGVTHFDVARSYGFGRAERVVGSFLKGRRDKVTVTSKFGVVPPNLNFRTKALIPVARTIAQLIPQLKARLTKKSGQLLASRNFDVAYARQCLNQSLTELNTDYIDIYLLHEPDRSSLLNLDELKVFLEESVSTGKIRRWGVAFGSVADFGWRKVVGGDVVQFEGNINTLPKCGSVLDEACQRIVTRPFMGGLGGKHALGDLVEALGLTPILQEMNASLGDVALCLSQSLAGQSGTVLCSMFSPDHVRKNVRAINSLSTDLRMNQVIDAILQSPERIVVAPVNINQ